MAGLVSYFVFAIFGVAAGNANATITASDYGASIIDYLNTFGTSEAIIFARYYGIIFLFIALFWVRVPFVFYLKFQYYQTSPDFEMSHQCLEMDH